ASISNTVLSLSALQKHDDKPFVVCICAVGRNHLLLANTTMLSKISHSSKELRIDNIRGSFNGSDILRSWSGIANTPANFDALFAIHQNFSFEENLVRLVETTNNISPTGEKFNVHVGDRLTNIMQSPERASRFVDSLEFSDLFRELNTRTETFKNEILVAACIENVNLRGRIIEYLIAGEDAAMREQLVNVLVSGNEFPRLVTRDGLGDYTKAYPDYRTETDIKTKIMILSSAPKGYNLDKMLEFLSDEKSVFMIFFVGIDYIQKSIKTKLISMFQNTLVDNTVMQSHWAGRNSRGVSQFNGEAIKRIILNEENTIAVSQAKTFLERIVAM
ncbi:MAG: hypothetical protein FWE69_07385, partial [Clostridiales bacterium]|nr:hypothetical protein [Clostridiales bacterium]